MDHLETQQIEELEFLKISEETDSFILQMKRLNPRRLNDYGLWLFPPSCT